MINHNIQNINELYNTITSVLNEKEINFSSQEAKIIICTSANEIDFSLINSQDINFSKLNSIINERIKGKPLAKIINQKGFWNNIFYTNDDTLDPRADSEILIESICNDFYSIRNSKIYFLDLCSGTGCLGLSLLEELPNSQCTFIDISKKSIDANKLNANSLDLINRSFFIISDLFTKYTSDINKNDFIVCNPPYIISKDLNKLSKETLYDPILSLDGGIDGCFFYNLIINQLKKLEYKGLLYFEIDPKIQLSLEKLVIDNNLKILYKKNDYQGLERIIKLSFN